LIQSFGQWNGRLNGSQKTARQQTRDGLVFESLCQQLGLSGSVRCDGRIFDTLWFGQRIVG
jgi:hypothetical protein